MQQRASVLVVEDNQDMREAVVSYLSDAGYKVTQADSSEKVLDNGLYESTDIALLDISLPGNSGLEMTRELKARGYEGPIIAITARDTLDDKLIGLEVGMVDYIVKPFDLRELHARINAQLRNVGVQHDLATLTSKSFKLIPKKHQFFIGNKECKLTLVEFRIMLSLMQHNHTVVNTQELIETAWGEEAALSNPPIRIHISNLRNKIKDDQYTIVQTVPGVGYMLAD